MAMVFLLAFAVLAAFALCALCALVYQLIKQQGRLLLRLDGLEEILTRRQALPAPTMGNGNTPPAQPQGLPVGSAMVPLRLPDLTGKEVALEDFSGKRVLLTHWSPSCGFCHQIAPELAKLQRDLRKANTELVLVSYGEASANASIAKEHELDCPILLLADGQRLEAFDRLGTPVAYLLDEQHRVAEPIAIGANQVPELAREAATASKKKRRLPGERDLAGSRLVRDGLKAGTPAPSFTLPDVRGGQLSLEDLRGRRVLLTFSDPHCGPCDALVPDLCRLHREFAGNGCEVVMVGRGDVSENRRKVSEHGIEFPVVVQDHWKLSKKYGIFATPVAFLIDEDGVIAADVAQGADQIVALAREGLATRIGG